TARLAGPIGPGVPAWGSVPPLGRRPRRQGGEGGESVETERRIFGVSEINQYIKALLDGEPLLQGLLVRGEISNYKRYPSGHHYFTLKDAEGAIRCVLFRGNAA